MERALAFTIFFYGALAAGAALIALATLSLICEVLFDLSLEPSASSSVMTALIVGAITEEVIRVATLKKAVLEQNTVVGSIVPGLLFGIGFALVELVQYVLPRLHDLHFTPTLIFTPIVHIMLSILALFLLQRNTQHFVLIILFVSVIHSVYNISLL